MKQILFSFFAFATLLGWGGYVEGHFFPVVSPMKIVEVIPGTEYDDFDGVVPFVDIYFTTEKHYDCEFGRVSFRRYDGKTITYREPEETGGSRAPGKFGAGPYRLYGVSPLGVRRMRAFTSHSCPGRPWTTHTDFSPASNEDRLVMVPFLVMAKMGMLESDSASSDASVALLPVSIGGIYGP